MDRVPPATTSGRSIAGIDVPLLLGGTLTLGLSYLMYRFFAPSPHGLLELVFALPLACLGVGALGGAFVVDASPTFRAARFFVGYALIAVAVTPVVYVAWELAR